MLLHWGSKSSMFLWESCLVCSHLQDLLLLCSSPSASIISCFSTSLDLSCCPASLCKHFCQCRRKPCSGSFDSTSSPLSDCSAMSICPETLHITRGCLFLLGCTLQQRKPCFRISPLIAAVEPLLLTDTPLGSLQSRRGSWLPLYKYEH